MQKVRILLADDHEIVRDGIRAILEKQPDFEIVGVTGDGLEAIGMIGRTDMDVIVMDIHMPHIDGIEATRRIKEFAPHVKILTLSVYSQGAIIAQMIRAGSAGYLTKTCASNELVEAIRSVLRGHTYISPEIYDSVTEYLYQEPDDSQRQHPNLTSRECEVLSLISDGKTTKDISNLLHVSERTVEFHRHNIMDKLDMHSIAKLTKYAIREGLTPLEKF